MAGRASKFRLVRCPRCCKPTTEYAHIPRYCSSCNTLLQAKNCNVVQEFVTSGSGSISLRTFLNSSEQSIASSSSMRSTPSSNAERTVSVKERKTPFPIQCKQDESISREKDSKNPKNKQERPSGHARNRYRPMSRRTFRLERVSESIGGESNGEDVGYFQTEQQLNKLSLKGRNSCKEIAANDSKLKCIDEAHVRLFNSMNSHQSSICEACSRCSYHSSVKEQVKNSSMKEKKHQAMRHCRPIFNAAPFFTCNKCFKLLQLPEDFLVSKRGLKKLRCGACAEVLVLSFSSASLKERSCFHGRKGKEEVPPLHQLMGYFSATELLCQVSEEDEGYESSEPAMPDSYKVYEKVRKNQLLQQVKDEVENDDSYKILRKTALPPLNSLVKGVRRTWARNSGSMKLKAPVKQ